MQKVICMQHCNLLSGTIYWDPNPPSHLKNDLKFKMDVSLLLIRMGTMPGSMGKGFIHIYMYYEAIIKLNLIFLSGL